MSCLIDYFEPIRIRGLIRPKWLSLACRDTARRRCVAKAFDPRVAAGFIASSGEGGAKLFRRNFGEPLENLALGGYHWMAGNYMKYAADEAAFERKRRQTYQLTSMS